jgi:diguanylate cyclase (GGDEF)-like protein/PAS domain S-box-containing protein
MPIANALEKRWRKKKMLNNPVNENSAIIMVVDDDTVIRLMLKKLLEDQGHHIILAENGELALALFQQHQPELVLMDAAMPVLDGFSACARIKQLPGGKETPILMITALYDDNSVDQAFAAGALEYITKPIHLAALRYRVNTLLKARRAELAVARSEARFRGVFSHSALGIALVDTHGVILDSNPALQRIVGHHGDDLHGRAFRDFFQPTESRPEHIFHQELLKGIRASYQLEKYFFHPDGQLRWCNLNASVVRDPTGDIHFFIYMAEDVTLQKQAQLRQRIALKVFENTNDGIMITDAEGRITYVNHAFTVVTGYSYEEVLDKHPRLLKSGQHKEDFYENLWSAVNNSGRWRGEVWNKRRDGQIYSEWLSISAVRDDLNKITNYVAVFSDITTLQGSDEHVKRLLHYDERIYRLTRFDILTDLPNRLLFHECLTRVCREGAPLALLFVDIDGFSAFNQELGYEHGDELLKAVAQRLQQCVNDNDALARVENDQFAIILAPMSQSTDAEMLAEKVFKALHAPIVLAGRELPLDAHIGISFYDNTHHSAEESHRQVEYLIQRAELAMYLAKEKGRNIAYMYLEPDSENSENSKNSAKVE